MAAGFIKIIIVYQLWGYSSAGRAPALQAGGHEFESHYLHSLHIENLLMQWLSFTESKTYEP